MRIELDAQQVAEHPLRIGLSTLVKVDTTNLDGLVLSDTVRQKPLFETSALTLDLAPVNQMIADVIHANAG
ncbi:Multidrug export protein EmrA [compost metagenome]